MSKTINRIVKLISTMGLSARQFDISIGSANGYTLRMEKNNASVGSDVIERIAEKYPRVNLVWLITGEGDMFIDEKPASVNLSEANIQQMIDEEVKQSFESNKQALLQDIKAEIERASQGQ